MPQANVAPVLLLLCGDVMTGRGIDQILPHPCSPRLYEDYVHSALDYVALAERANGPIPRAVGWDYVWGEALAVLDREAPDLRLINLETAITTQAVPAPKGINYRMHPDNVSVLTSAKVDGAVLANNHILDWGPAGLAETVARLQDAGIVPVGAGRDQAHAQGPGIWPLATGGRLLLWAYGLPSSGVPPSWAANAEHGGVNWLADLSSHSVIAVADAIRAQKQTGDIAVVSLHWGRNWGYALEPAQRHFAHALIDEAGVDLVWGHSSHHPRPLEVHRGKLILYGCGDVLNDYEGIEGYEHYRPELVLLYLPTLATDDGHLRQLRLLPFELRHFRLNAATAGDAHWLAHTLSRESHDLGVDVVAQADGHLDLRW